MQIVVLGMHRSGTSAVTRLINMMGASIGSVEQVGRPAEDNAKGFWERAEIRDINDAALAACGAAWDDPWGFSPDALPAATREELDHRIAEVIFSLDVNRPWVMKDPRLSLTLPLWTPRLEAAVVVIALRHPDAVAESLRARNGLPLALGRALWETHLQQAARASVGAAARVWVDYEALVDQPARTMEGLHRDLVAAGCSGLRLPSAREVEGFIDGEMRHHAARSDSPLHSRFIALLQGDAQARRGDWPLSADSADLLRWQSALRIREASASSASEGRVPSPPAGDLQVRLDETRAQLDQSAALAQAHATDASLLRDRLRQQQSEFDLQRGRADAFASTFDALERERTQLLQRVERQAAEVAVLEQRCERARRDAEDHDVRERARLAAIAASLSDIHARTAADARQLARWLDDVLGLAQASFSSMRWRVGNAVVRVCELLLLRRRPRLASDHIEAIGRNLRAWRQGRDDTRAMIDLVQSQLLAGDGDAGSSSFARPASIARGLPIPAKASAGGLDVICFPVIDWHFRVQRPQHLARVAAARGHRVFYLSTHPEAGCDANGFDILETPAPNVWLVRLRIRRRKHPNLYRECLEGAALEDYRDAVDAMRAALGIRTPVALVDLPFWRPLVESIPGATLIYDCMDHHAGFSTNEACMLDEEARLLRSADEVVVTSAWLERRLGSERRVHLIRNGADVERFAVPPAQPAFDTTRPVVGYLGAIAEWFDVALLAAGARAMPDVDFVLVGDVTHPHTTVLRALPNVRFLGEVPYEQAPAYVHGFDVCIIPFLINDLTLATNPVKVYEYLAAGKQVVATRMPELADMDGLVRLVDDAEAFVEQLRDALRAAGDQAHRAERRRWAGQHDWEHRGEALEQVMRAALPRASVIVLAWNNLDFTRACLESLERHTDYPDWELVLVDNASTDGTVDFFREFAATRPSVRLVLNDANLGFAAGNNAGIRVATGDVVVVLNNDTYVTPGWLAALIGHLRRNPSLGIVGPVTNNIGNEARIEVSYGDMEQMLTATREWTREHPRGLTPVDVVAFFCCAIPRDVIDAVGLLDEAFGQGFFEDDDYCRRIRALGRRVAIADDVFVHHHLSASFSTLKEERRRELFERNKAIFEQKWGPWTPHRYRAR